MDFISATSIQWHVEYEPLTFADMFQRDPRRDLEFALGEFQPLVVILVHVFPVDDEHTAISDLLHHFGSGCHESGPPIHFTSSIQEYFDEIDIHDVD